MVKSLATKNIAAVALGLGLVLALAFSFATPAKAVTIEELQAQIQLLLSQIASLQGSSSTTVSGAGCYTFTRNHSQGDSGGEVMWIQTFLNNHGAQVSVSGAGSPGNETSYFGPATKAAVIKFQNMYAADVLAPVGLSAGTGYWGSSSRAKANALCAGASTPGTGPVVPVGTGLRVSLASDSPTSSNVLVKSQGIAELAKFTFTNGSGAPVTVTNLAFKRIGVSTDSDISNVYLYNGAARLTDPAGISSSNFNFNNSQGIFTVPAGGSVSVTVRADIGSTNGSQVGAQLTGVTASSPLDASVVLPISGSLMTISNATIATATWSATTPSGGTFAPADDTTLFQNTLTINNRASWLKSIQFENRGSTSDSDFQNLKLYVKGVQVGGTMSLSNDKVTFDLSASPLKLETGGNEIRLVGDIVAGSGETFDFQIRRGIDIMLIDSELNQPLAPSAPSSVSENTVEGVSLSVVKSNTSPTDNVAVAASNVVWGKFEFRAAGDNLKIEQITVTADNTPDGSMDNVRIMLDGAQVGSTADLTASSTTFSLGSSMILTAGKTHVVEIYGDAKTSSGSNFTSGVAIDVGVAIAVADTEGMSSGDRISSAISEVEGNARTVTSSTLTGSKASGYGNQTMVAGTNNAKVGSFTLSTGSTEGVNVNTILVTLSTAEAASVTDLRLVDNATGAQIGTAKSSPSTSNTFSVNMVMAASQTKVIDVYANIKSGANAGPWIAELTSTTGGTGAVTGTSVTIGSSTDLQTITVAGTGTLTISRDAGTPANSNVIAGSTGVHVGRFDFSAANSSFTIQELKVDIRNGVATSTSLVTLKYKNSSGVEETKSQSVVTSSSASGTATFTGLAFYVPQNDSADVDVYVDIPTVISGATSGTGIWVALSDTGFKSIDGAGTQATTGTYVASNASSGYGTKYVKKSVPVIAKTNSGLSGSSVTAGAGLYRFTVTADNAGSIDLYKIAFNVATSGTSFSGWELHDAANLGTALGSASVTTGTKVTVDLSSAIQEIGAGSAKTYELRATTVTGWDTNDSITIDIASDTVATTTQVASALGANNTIWSDRSATSHSSGSADFTNGYLVKDVDNDYRTCTASTSGTSCN